MTGTPVSRPRGPPDGDDMENQIVDILKFSQQDLNRMRREWELVAQNQQLTRDKEHTEKMELQHKEKQQLHKEIQQLHDKEKANT